jgi:membrane protein implicated in regulation of membrane protease activity
MKAPRIFYWTVDEPRQLAHPYRDTMIVYAVLALIIVGLALLTGGSLGKAVVIAALFYVAATAWSLVSWRRRLRKRPPDPGAQGGAEE